MKETSRRVDPRISPSLIAYIVNYGLKVNWDKPDHDSHTTFKGSAAMLARVDAFVAGFNSGYEEAENVQAQNCVEN
jgi:hypothetical protein